MRVPAPSTSPTSSVPLAPKAVRAPGTAGGLCRPVGGGGREEGDKHGWSHFSFPSHLPSLLRIPEMLGSTPGPRSLPALSLPPSCFQLSRRRLRPCLFPVLVTWASEGLRWPLQGAAGEAGDAAAAGDGGTEGRKEGGKGGRSQLCPWLQWGWVGGPGHRALSTNRARSEGMRRGGGALWDLGGK